MDKQDVSGQLVQKHEQIFALVYQDAITDLATLYEKTRPLFNSIEYANVMHAHVRHHAKRHFAGKPGISIREKKGRAFCIEIDGAPHNIAGRAVVKLKKLNAALIARNIPTQAVIRFNTQEVEQAPYRVVIQQGLFGEDKTIIEGADPANLIVGYLPNPLFTKIERVCATYPTGLRTSQLILEISLDGGTQQGQIFQMPAADVAEKAPRRRIKPRSTPFPQKQDEAQTKQRIEREEDRQEKRDSNVTPFRKKASGNESSG
ncbi:MAG: hypothetical protein SF097_12260 [Acidobacteriota bacterium]|nr:hypothetical protein [Acidobacteriota bacterium]